MNDLTTRPGTSRRHALLLVLLVLGATLIAHPAAAATTISIRGRVACPQGHDVVGVWVQSSNGGSTWADWRPGSIAAWQATYRADIHIRGSRTDIELHVGCGGSASDWMSNNQGDVRTGVSADRVISTICSYGRRTGDRCRPWGDTVIVGMPFRGRWGNRYHDGSSWTTVHPSTHDHHWGEWGHDLYGDHGQAVYAQAWQNLGWPELRFLSKRPTCASGRIADGGWNVELGVYRNGQRVGTVWYGHLNDVPAFTRGQNVRGRKIGELDRFRRSSCYQVSTDQGVHTHVEMATSGSRYSCYWNRRVTSTQSRYRAIGMVGRTSGHISGPRQGCAGSYHRAGEISW